MVFNLLNLFFATICILYLFFIIQECIEVYVKNLVKECIKNEKELEKDKKNLDVILQYIDKHLFSDKVVNKNKKNEDKKDEDIKDVVNPQLLE